MPTPVSTARRLGVAYQTDYPINRAPPQRVIPRLEVVPAPPMPPRTPATSAEARANRLVSREEMDHYMRQGERIADVLMAIGSAFGRLVDGFRRTRQTERPRLGA